MATRNKFIRHYERLPIPMVGLNDPVFSALQSDVKGLAPEKGVELGGVPSQSMAGT